MKLIKANNTENDWVNVQVFPAPGTSMTQGTSIPRIFDRAKGQVSKSCKEIVSVDDACAESTK